LPLLKFQPSQNQQTHDTRSYDLKILLLASGIKGFERSGKLCNWIYRVWSWDEFPQQSH